MLDACAEILEESGYDGLSTTLVARRAGVAIGSVYQFFPGKRAMAQALVLRHLDQFGDRVGRRLADKRVEHWSDVVGVVLSVYVDMHRTVTGFGALRLGDVVDGHPPDTGQPDTAVIVERMRTLLVTTAGVEDTPKLTRVLAVAVEAGHAVLRLAFRSDKDGDERILAELDQLIHRYLAPHLDRPADSGPPRPSHRRAWMSP